MAFGKKQDGEQGQLHLPVHIGIIMDGNGRWAQKRLLPRSAGHRAGASNFRTITRYCSKIGIQYLTIYAFSTENWSRPAEEVGGLLRLLPEDRPPGAFVPPWYDMSAPFVPRLRTFCRSPLPGRQSRPPADTSGLSHTSPSSVLHTSLRCSRHL